MPAITTIEEERRRARRDAEFREANAAWEENALGEAHRIRVIVARAVEANIRGGRDPQTGVPLDA